MNGLGKSLDDNLLGERGLTGMDLWGMFQGAAELYGLPFALFIALLVYVLWTNNRREQRYIDREDKYIEIVQTLSEDVKERLTVIETEIKHMKG